MLGVDSGAWVYSSDSNRTGVSNEYIRAPGAGGVRGDECAVCVSFHP